jgi:hypothetical protein
MAKAQKSNKEVRKAKSTTPKPKKEAGASVEGTFAAGKNWGKAGKK